MVPDGSPANDHVDSQVKRRCQFWGRCFFVCAVSGMVSLIGGVVVNVMGMLNAFETISKGAGKTEELSDGIGMAMTGTTIGILGVVIFSIGILISLLQRRKWRKRFESGVL